MSGETNLTICILIMPWRPPARGRRGLNKATAKLAGMSFRCIQNYPRLIHPVEDEIKMRQLRSVFWFSYQFVKCQSHSFFQYLTRYCDRFSKNWNRMGRGREFIFSNLVISPTFAYGDVVHEGGYAVFTKDLAFRNPMLAPKASLGTEECYCSFVSNSISLL